VGHPYRAASGSLGDLQGPVSRTGAIRDIAVGIYPRRAPLRRGLCDRIIWEGKKGEPSKPVMPLDLNVRPILDGNYIIPKTVEYIKRNAAAKKPFFVY